jgi:hypothetical protein
LFKVLAETRRIDTLEKMLSGSTLSDLCRDIQADALSTKAIKRAVYEESARRKGEAK